MKINELTKVTKLDADHYLVVDGANGTKIILAKDAIVPMIGSISPEMHRNIFRGKNLGNAYTSAQKDAVANGSFDDLYVGDYWTNGSVIWRIGDINYWQRCGDTDFTTPHLLIVPDAPLYNHVMNDDASTVGGYVSSKMYKEGLAQAKTQATAFFGAANVLTHKEYLINAVANGRPSGGAWLASTVELMNEKMVYGTHVFAPVSDGVNVPTNYTVDKSQIALFQLAPRFIHNRYTYWLRDVVSASAFATVRHCGSALYNAASVAYGVRPAFPVG